ncbi:MAG: acyl carrier protein [Rhodospirillaceae bacterium]|nr:acyl carrier protein [Rhodospirillaceae bacterium]MCY4312066.1 acyl carrier protein [Rhodospirillaceae bacterium]
MTEFNQETFELVAEIISDICSINRADITPDTHTVDDLGIDSLDFLDVTFDIDKRFGIKMPVEQWMEEVNQGNADADEFFVMKNLVTRIEELRAEKAA